MKIIKYRKGTSGLYKVELDDGRVLSLYEDVILKYELLLKREILECDLYEIENINREYEVYYVALKSIKSRFKSTYDVKEMLIKNYEVTDLEAEEYIKLYW